MASSPVRQRGTDSSGRPIFASDKLWAVWVRIAADRRLEDLADLLAITQGSWMSLVPGGGAAASAGVHDRGGCFDLRSRTLTPAQQLLLIKVCRSYAGGAWLRNEQHGGFDQHIHVVFGFDDNLAPAAARQWTAYVNGRDGLAGNGPDYHDRPSPLVKEPPGKGWAPRAGVLAARKRAIRSMRSVQRAARRLRKSKDPALVKVRAVLVAAARRLRWALAKLPKR